MPQKNKAQPEESKIAQEKKEKRAESTPKKKGGKRENSTKKSEKKKLTDIEKKIKNIGLEKEVINGEERQFLRKIKSFGIKLRSILKKEATIENKIEEIERLEKTVSPKKRSQIEKKRWKMDAKRRKIEKTKWLIQKNIKKAEEKIKATELKDRGFSEQKKKLEKKKEQIFQKRETELSRKKIDSKNKISQPISKEGRREELQEVLNKENPLIEKTKGFDLLLKTSQEEEIKMKQKEREKREEEQKIREEEEDRKQRKEEEIKKAEEIKRKQEEEKRIQEKEKKKEEELKKQDEEKRKVEEPIKKQDVENSDKKEMGKVSEPYVSTKDPFNIGEFSADSGGNVTNDGGGLITARGVCWNSPTTADAYTEDGTGLGLFDSYITGLTPGTTYYVRAYATNKAGTAYGEQKSFTTVVSKPFSKIENQAVEPEKKPGFLTKLFGRLTPHIKIKVENRLETIERVRGREEEEIKRKQERKDLEEQKKELIKQFEEELKIQRDGLAKQHKEELEKKELERKKQEEEIIKEKFIPYIPEELIKQQELIKQLKKEEQELRRQHKKELEKQAEEIMRRQKEELKRQEEEWRIGQEESRIPRIQREELTKRHKGESKSENKELERKKQEEEIIREKYIPYIPYIPEELIKQQELIKQSEKPEEELTQQKKEAEREELERRKKEGVKEEGEEVESESGKEQKRKKREELEIMRREIEEEVRKIEQERLRREELIKTGGKPKDEWEGEELTEEQEKKKREELEVRRKEIEEEVRKIDQEELRREELEKIKMEEKAKKEKEELERKEKAERSGSGKEKTNRETTKDKKEESVSTKERPLSEEEIRERERKEKELQPTFELAVKNYKEKEFDKASDLFIKIKDQAVEPEKDPGFLAKLQNKLPLYIKAENYLKKIDKQKAIIEKETARKIRKETKKESKEKRKEEKQILFVQKEEWKKQPFSSTVFDFFRRRVLFYNPIIGIDISDHSIEILYLNKQRSILAYGRTTFEEGIVRDGEIINQKDLTQALRLTAQRAGFQPFDPRKGALLRAIVNLPEPKTYIQIFAFDSRLNLYERVKEKIENTIPFPINDLYWSYIESWDKNQNPGKTKVLCVAVLKDIVNSQIHFLKSSGISPIVFDIEAASIGRALLSGQKTKEKGCTLILDIGARTTNLNIFDKNGFISLSVTIPYAGLDFAAKITDRLGVSKEKAEIMMGEKGFKKEDNPFLPVLEEEVEKITKEVRQSINYYQGEFGENVEKIILAGGSSLLPEIDSFFQKHFEGIKVEIGNPLEKIRRKGGMREERAILYSNVIGLALRSISKNPARDGINLLPEEIRSRTK